MTVSPWRWRFTVFMSMLGFFRLFVLRLSGAGFVFGRPRSAPLVLLLMAGSRRSIPIPVFVLGLGPHYEGGVRPSDSQSQ